VAGEESRPPLIGFCLLHLVVLAAIYLDRKECVWCKKVEDEGNKLVLTTELHAGK
jgi:hypothetical protein